MIYFHVHLYQFYRQLELSRWHGSKLCNINFQTHNSRSANVKVRCCQSTIKKQYFPLKFTCEPMGSIYIWNKSFGFSNWCLRWRKLKELLYISFRLLIRVAKWLSLFLELLRNLRQICRTVVPTHRMLKIEYLTFKILWHYTRCKINSRGLKVLNFEWNRWFYFFRRTNNWLIFLYCS